MPIKRSVIAVIDDNLDILCAISRLLSAYGYDSELYASLKEFLEAVITTEAIGLIVDIQLGNSCGVEGVRQLAKTGIALPIIFMTANDSEWIRRRALDVGCVAFLRKPFSPNDLIQALAQFPARGAVFNRNNKFI